MDKVKLAAKQIFVEALDRQSPEELPRYLDEACGSDTELRSHVEDLLKAHHQVDSFLGGPPPTKPTIDGPVAKKPGTTILEESGTRIGPYIIREQIGEGGSALYTWPSKSIRSRPESCPDLCDFGTGAAWQRIT